MEGVEFLRTETKRMEMRGIRMKGKVIWRRMRRRRIRLGMGMKEKKGNEEEDKKVKGTCFRRRVRCTLHSSSCYQNDNLIQPMCVYFCGR